MIARLLICPDLNLLKSEIQKTLASHLTSGNVNHPDLLYFKTGEKLGITEAKKIKEFFSLKPYSAKGRITILEDASVLTNEAQNALLKTIEELPKETILILGAPSGSNFLPTVLSRCEIINLQVKGNDTPKHPDNYVKDLERLLISPMEDRFEYIEKLKEKEEFLLFMILYFRKQFLQSKSRQLLKDFLIKLLHSEKWIKQNVNTRAILEYLMLVMPEK